MPDFDKRSQELPINRSALGRCLANISKCGCSILEWIGRHVAVVLTAHFLIIFAIWVFALLAYQVVAGSTLSFDNWALASLRRPNEPAKLVGPDWLPEVGRDLTALGGVAVLTLLTLAVAGFLCLRRMYSAMLLLLASTLGGLLVSTFLKSLFDRPRPDVVPHLSMVVTSSFPSGHSMLSATVYLTLGALLGRFFPVRRLQAYFLLIALLLTFLVGVSRIYMGVHYPTDVLAGWTAGFAWALLCWQIARWLQHRGKVESAPTSDA